MTAETPRECLLIVDDTPENIDVLAGVLSPEYRTRVALNGKKALDICGGDAPPDLILLDIMMPGMDGYEVCRRLKASERTRDIPVIFVTARAEEQDETRGFALGAVDYITKPVSPTIVKARVRTHLDLLEHRREIERNYARLQELEELRDNLTHMIIHDMRTPLMGAMGGVQLLSGGEKKLDVEAEEHVNMALSAVRELDVMVTSLLDISRIESGKLALECNECDVKSLAVAIADRMAPNAEFEEMQIAVSGESVFASVDEKLIERVFQNLLNNAIKFSPAHSTVKVAVSADEENVRVTVTDSGCGIPEKYQEKIFEKFGQIEARQNREKHSTGLGLTFCKLAVEAHGGRIGVVSPVTQAGEDGPGRGSTFWFTLPH